MSFLGNTPTTQSFTSLTERFNGDGSTTTITLSRAVYNASDIEVIVNNVQQDPYDAYTVNGTQTLTFTEAPSSGTGNIIVTYRSYIISKFIPGEGTVTAAAIADGSITGVKLASSTITGDKIGLTAITGNLIAAAAITGDKIGLTAINANNIVNATITGDKIGLNAITSNLISANAITTAAIADGSINTSELAAGAVTGDKIGLTAINANNIVDGTITGAKIASATITGDKIGLTAITSNLIASGVTLTSPVIASANLTTALTLNGATGNNGQVLTSSGSGLPSWANPSAGALTLLSTVTASAAATVDIETTFNSTYDQYVIYAPAFTLSGNPTNSELKMRLKIGGTYPAVSGYMYASNQTNGSTYAGLASSNNDAIYLCATLSDATSFPKAVMDLIIYVSKPSTTNRYKTVMWQGSHTFGNNPNTMNGVGWYSSSDAALTGVRLLFAGGATFTGTFRLYGISNS
jgi:hypothetical protein